MAQKLCNMKDARKQITASAPNPDTCKSAQRSVEDDLFLDNDVFAKAPAPRLPESPDEEHFRSFLKHQMPRHRASQALSQKIKSSLPLQDCKKA